MKKQTFKAIDRSHTYALKYENTIKKFGTNDLMPLWVADMDIAAPKCVQKILIKRAKHPVYGYTMYPERYFKAIKKWMKDRFEWKIKKEWIVPCYGVVPSINSAIEAYTNKGDGIIIQSPVYPRFAASIQQQKRKILDNILIYEKGKYKIDFVDFEKKAKKAKLFLLCSPHNPIGKVWSRKELEKIIEICIANDVLIVSDEIHADIVYKKKQYSMGSFKKIQKQCIVLNAPSKTFSITGLNTSYAIIPNEKLRRKYILKQNKVGITKGTPFGIEALISVYEKGTPWLNALNVHLEKNTIYVKTFLEEHDLPIYAVKTEGTFLVWLDCRKMKMSQEELVRFFVEDAKLGLNNGISFGKSGDGFMRLNAGTSKEILEEAMHRLLNAYNKRKH